ncbi:MAG TPA: helix-turn-helix domain-containing protein [Pseudonocardiaceae bacterium]|nr:helix-turn-helix domain-containing protein [Pseudonocardiaceae bacterium]
MRAHDALWDSARARALIVARDIGGVVRLARQTRSWRQVDLAKAAGYSASTISRLETSRRASVDVEMLRRVAHAAGIPGDVLGALLGLSAPTPATVAAITGRRAEEDDPMRRRELLGTAGFAVPLRLLTTLDDALVLQPAPVRASSPTDIAARLACARRRFDASDLARLVADLPDLLAAAQEAAEQDGNPAAHARLAACYDLAAEALSKIGCYSSGRITADRATTCAALSGSPIAMAASARALGIVLRHEGRQRIADQITLTAACRLEATGLVTPAQSAAYAQMLCTCAYNAAQAGDRDRTLELITEAERAADRLPDHPVDGQPFTVTPAQVTLYRVGVHWSLGDAGAALHAGRGLHPGQFTTPERRGRLHTDIARAWWQWGKPEQTARALLAAHHQAPAEVRDRPAILKIVTDLAGQHPRVAGVRELATAVVRRRDQP